MLACDIHVASVLRYPDMVSSRRAVPERTTCQLQDVQDDISTATFHFVPEDKRKFQEIQVHCNDARGP